jgi:hypothetical protein
MLLTAYPVAKKTTESGDGKVIIKSNFTKSAIKKIWNADPKVASEYIYIDKEILERLNPGIIKTYEKDEYPFGKLPSYDAMPPGDAPSRWKLAPVPVQVFTKSGMISNEKKPVKADVMIRNNGGWIINEGNRAKSGKFCKHDKDDKNRAIACNGIAALGMLQNKKGYHFKAIAGRIESSENEIIADVDENVKKKIAAITDDPEYSAYAMLNPRIMYWVRTDDIGYINETISTIVDETKKISSGSKTRIRSLPDLERWTSNVFNDGNGIEGVLSKFPFVPNKEVMRDETAYFSKEDFASAGAFSKSCSNIGSAVLVDGDGRFIQVNKGTGKKLVKDVISDASVNDLKKWEWACLAHNKPRTETSVVPRIVEHKKGIDAIVDKGKIKIARKNIDAEMKDVIAISWNAMVKSRLRSSATKEKLLALPTSILKEFEKVSGKKNVTAVAEAYIAGMKEPIFIEDEGKIVDGPYITTRKFNDVNGIPPASKIGNLIRKGASIVGIETSLANFSKGC